MELRHLLPALTLVTSLVHAGTSRDVYALDSFESATSLTRWRISGAGSLRLGPGYRGSGAVLSYKVGRENPVTLTWHPDRSMPKVQNSIVSLWARFSPSVDLTLKA